jgi:hypothetical protein
MIINTFKRLLPLATGILFLAACSSSKNAGSTAGRDDIKGTWQLDRINIDGISASEKVKLTLLDEGDEKCLTGSTWVFPNNGYGSYTIATTATGCAPGQRSIIWSSRNDGGQTYLQYKILPGGVQAKDVTDGYRLKVVSATGGVMQLQSETSFEGKPLVINYSFSKK